MLSFRYATEAGDELWCFLGIVDRRTDLILLWSKMLERVHQSGHRETRRDASVSLMMKKSRIGSEQHELELNPHNINIVEASKLHRHLRWSSTNPELSLPHRSTCRLSQLIATHTVNCH